jgi:hypothetical protein
VIHENYGPTCHTITCLNALGFIIYLKYLNALLPYSREEMTSKSECIAYVIFAYSYVAQKILTVEKEGFRFRGVYKNFSQFCPMRDVPENNFVTFNVA